MPARGFGFIKPDGAQENVFVSLNEVTKLGVKVKMGQRVAFDLVTSSTNKLRARNLRLID
jgi:cold shock protein